MSGLFVKRILILCALFKKKKIKRSYNSMIIINYDDINKNLFTDGEEY